jgi:hypothetical protein
MLAKSVLVIRFVGTHAATIHAMTRGRLGRWVPSSTRAAPSRFRRFLQVICPTGKSVKSLSSPSRKNISVFPNPNQLYIHRHPVPHRGAFRDRHGRWARDAVDAAASGARSARGRMMLIPPSLKLRRAGTKPVEAFGVDGCGRRSRVVLTPRRWCQVLREDARDDGDKKARSPGRARYKPLKPLRGECRVFPV